MARLIEFFTRTGELVLDPFAGVGGTLLGAAIARGPRRALGIELDERWVAVYEAVVREASAAREGAGPLLADLGSQDPGGLRSFDPAGSSSATATRSPSCRAARLGGLRRDRPAVQHPARPDDGRRCPGRALRQPSDRLRHGQRPPGRPRQQPGLPGLPRPHGGDVRRVHRVLRPGRYATVIVRDAYQDGRYLFTGSDLAARAEQVGLVPKGDLIWYQAGTRLRPYGYPRSFVPNIAHQHILVLRRGR